MLLGIFGQAIPSLVSASWVLLGACLWIKMESSFYVGADKVEGDLNARENFPFMATLRHDFQVIQGTTWIGVLLESKLHGSPPAAYYI